MADIPDAVHKLARELRDIFGARLHSLIAYGLRTGEAARDHGALGSSSTHERARTQTMAVVDTVALTDLRACATRVASWHDDGLATPLLVAAHELERSLDAFPLEFGAILADHVVAWGNSPFNGSQVDVAGIRRACEVQAQSHLMHLREGYLETRGRGDALAVLIVRSAAPFAALLGSVARLQGLGTHDGPTVARHAERALNLPGGIVADVVKLAHVREISSADATRLFPAYFDAVERLAKYIDGWSTASRL